MSKNVVMDLLCDIPFSLYSDVGYSFSTPSEWVVIDLRKYISAEVINGIRPSTNMMNKLGSNHGLVNTHYHPNNFIIPAIINASWMIG